MGVLNYRPFTMLGFLGLYDSQYCRSIMVRGRRVLVNRANDNLGVPQSSTAHPMAGIHPKPQQTGGLVAEAVGGCAFCLERKPAKWICCTRAITGVGSSLRNQNVTQSIFNITVARLPCHVTFVVDKCAFLRYVCLLGAWLSVTTVCIYH